MTSLVLALVRLLLLVCAAIGVGVVGSVGCVVAAVVDVAGVVVGIVDVAVAADIGARVVCVVVGVAVVGVAVGA